MENIEWKEVEPQQKDWERQIDIMFCEICMLGSIVYFGADMGWGSVIDGAVDVLLAGTEEEAQKEVAEVIISNCDDAIAHYTGIKESIDQLNFRAAGREGEEDKKIYAHSEKKDSAGIFSCCQGARKEFRNQKG